MKFPESGLTKVELAAVSAVVVVAGGVGAFIDNLIGRQHSTSRSCEAVWAQNWANQKRFLKPAALKIAGRVLEFAESKGNLAPGDEVKIQDDVVGKNIVIVTRRDGIRYHITANMANNRNGRLDPATTEWINTDYQISGKDGSAVYYNQHIVQTLGNWSSHTDISVEKDGLMEDGIGRDSIEGNSCEPAHVKEDAWLAEEFARNAEDITNRALARSS